MTDTDPLFMSSGDLIADRRFHYAAVYAGRGDHVAARDLLQQTVELVPSWPAAWATLGDAEAVLGRAEAARAAYAKVLALAPDDPFGASLKLARLGVMESPPHAPDAYVRQLFDAYAARFETHLVDRLAYRGPELLAEAIGQTGRTTFSHAIDLGCGTGLAGAVFRSRVARLTGVDLAPRMIEAARAKQIYERLAVRDICSFLAGEPRESADLVLAADVVVYIGDVTPLFVAAHRVLRRAGFFAFTAQQAAQGFELGADLRFAHAPRYIRARAAQAAFKIRVLDDAPARQDAGQDVAGLVVVLEK